MSQLTLSNQLPTMSATLIGISSCVKMGSPRLFLNSAEHAICVYPSMWDGVARNHDKSGNYRIST